jgi:hypothetical protein
VTASRSAFVAGPNQVGVPNAAFSSEAELAPINRLAVFGTLQYDLP